VRLFVAVYPPPAALDHLAERVEQLRLGAAVAAGHNPRLAARPLWHLTLAFLGEVAEDRAPDVPPALAAGVARWRDRAGSRGGGESTPLRFRLAGGGRFGRRRFTVLWVGLAGDLAGLRSLAVAARQALRSARLPYDRKPLRPHLTLARPGDRLPVADLAADVAALRPYEGPEWTMSELHLVRSTLGPKPVHESVAVVPLAGPG
jgi:2'-5' RNA ligase